MPDATTASTPGITMNLTITFDKGDGSAPVIVEKTRFLPRPLEIATHDHVFVFNGNVTGIADDACAASQAALAEFLKA